MAFTANDGKLKLALPLKPGAPRLSSGHLSTSPWRLHVNWELLEFQSLSRFLRNLVVNKHRFPVATKGISHAHQTRFGKRGASDHLH